ncbi:MAG TPA: hypothetical protein VMW04_03250 [Patescibacteria group bacterium]|nr:hypothetical protein [Patescibacteria group bacterium]
MDSNTLSEDEVKEKILRYLYDFNKSRAQWTTSEKVIGDLRSAELDRIRIKNNIDYLIGEKYIDTRNERVKLTGQSILFQEIRISNKGIRLFEDSKFSQKALSSVTIEAEEGANVIFVSGHQYGTISQASGSSINDLDKLIGIIKEAQLSDEEKRNLVGDIEVIKAQLIKPNPTKKIIQAAWSAVGIAANLSGAHDLVTKIGQQLTKWLS